MSLCAVSGIAQDKSIWGHTVLPLLLWITITWQQTPHLLWGNNMKEGRKTTFSPSFGNNIFGSFSTGAIHHLPSQKSAGLPQNLTLYLPALGLCPWYPSHVKKNYTSEQELSQPWQGDTIILSWASWFPYSSKKDKWRMPSRNMLALKDIWVSSSFPVWGLQKPLKAVG